MEMNTTIITADTLEPSAMLELFNEGFSGYLVPMHHDEATFATHLHHNDIDLTASPVLVDGEPLAFALVGIRGEDAWIGGMGTVPAARRSGRARQVMRAAMESARARGCRTVWLEVIDANQAALALYEQLGFETVRDLLVWSLPQLSQPVEAVTVGLGHARSWIQANRESPEPWQRDDPLVTKLQNAGDDLRSIGVEEDGELAGAAIYLVKDGSVRILQIVAPDDVVAAALLRSAARVGPMWLGNVPADEPASQVTERLGGKLVARQHEMRFLLPRGSTPDV